MPTRDDIPPAGPSLEPSTQFLRETELRRGFELLLQASLSLSAASKQSIAETGLSVDHARALFFIKQHPGVRISDLVEQMRISKQSLNRLLETLEERDLISRKRDYLDGRSRRLTLTAKGQDLETKAFADIAQTLARGYAAVGQKAIAHTWQTLMHMLDDDARNRLLKID